MSGWDRSLCQCCHFSYRRTELIVHVLRSGACDFPEFLSSPSAKWHIKFWKQIIILRPLNGSELCGDVYIYIYIHRLVTVTWSFLDIAVGQTGSWLICAMWSAISILAGSRPRSKGRRGKSHGKIAWKSLKKLSQKTFSESCCGDVTREVAQTPNKDVKYEGWDNQCHANQRLPYTNYVLI